MIHEESKKRQQIGEIALFSPKVAIALGVEGATVVNRLQWCIGNDDMEGEVVDGVKYIRNPLVCTNPRKIKSAANHGKFIDWLSNFPWAKTMGRLRRIFKTLEDLGVLISKKLRASERDQCKYYGINEARLAELAEPLPLSICSNQTNAVVENDSMQLLTANKSYQDTFSKKDFQDQHPQDARANKLKPKPKPAIRKEGANSFENQKEDPIAHNSDKPIETVAEKIFLTPVNKEEIVGLVPNVEGSDQFSARLGSVNQAQQRDFFYKLIMYAQQCVNINSPEGYVKSTIRELKSSDPDPIARLLWEEYLSGEELGSRFTPFGYRLRGVPEQIIKEAIVQDQRGRVGTTGTEAAASAARNMAKAPIVRAVADAARQQLTRAREEAEKQVAMGISEERAIANCLPSYATAVVSVGSLVEAGPQNSITSAVEEEVAEAEEIADPNAMAIARAKIGEILNKFQRKTAKQRILEANRQEASQQEAQQREIEVQVPLVATVEKLEPIRDSVAEYLRELEEAEEIW